MTTPVTRWTSDDYEVEARRCAEAVDQETDPTWALARATQALVYAKLGDSIRRDTKTDATRQQLASGDRARAARDRREATQPTQ